MNKILLFVGVAILFGCNSKPKQNFTVPDKNDINEIVKVILTKDSTYRFYFKVLSVDLQKIKVYKSEQDKRPWPNFISDIPIKDLIEEKPIHQFLFKKTDSAYLFFQNDTLNHFKIRNDISSVFKITSLAEQYKKWNSHAGDSFVVLSIPIFSLDQKRAYVAISYMCRGLCGEGIAIFLQKINGHWEIVKRFSTWVS